MKCFGLCQFLCGLWMDISSEVANLHMRTDAKNLLTAERTIHLPEQKETVHMISVLRKEACSASIHDIAHIPTQNCFADCYTKASAKADDLITAVQTGNLLDVDIHPDFRTRMEHKAFMSTWCKTFFTQERRKSSPSLLSRSLLHTLQEGPFQVMLMGTQQQKKQNKLNTRKCKGQAATKKKSLLPQIHASNFLGH